MTLSSLDLLLIAGYLALTIWLGFWISKRASKNLDSYFLGEKSLPWYLLGMSNASGMFDITGTMWMVAICFVYGLKSVWFPWLWPVWNQIVLMMFLAGWMRRSNVMTGAEWLKTRFGTDAGAKLSHVSVVVFALVAVIGFIAYAFEGIGKFAVIFLPWDLSCQIGGLAIPSERAYALLIMGVTTIYVIKGGLYSVVLTEVMQFAIMTLSCIAIGVIAMQTVSGEDIARVVPAGWERLSFGWRMGLEWTAFTPEVNQALNEKIQQDGYELIGAFMMMMVFRGVLVSVAGPVPGYDMQRVLATRGPREAALMSGSVNLALYFPRYLMITGLAVLALVKLNPEQLLTADGIDFERVLPLALGNFLPTGLRGLVLAGLIAAFMSTFAANVNAGPAYLVNDIYKRFVNPQASSRTLVRLSYLASFLIVAAGVSLGFFVQDINQILQWITGALFGGYAMANFLKWIWWRFNGYGFFWGMLGGLVASLLLPRIMEKPPVLVAIPTILAASTVCCLLGTLLSKPDDMEVLKSFYRSVRPWGWWGPVLAEVRREQPDFAPNRDFLRDATNTILGIVWQTSLTVMPIYLVIRDYASVWVALAAFLAISVVLKFTWYDRLPPDDEAAATVAAPPAASQA